MATYKHLRSSTANKRPTTSIADGQLAINTNTASPGLFFKDSAGTGIVKVGPVHVGTTAPNSSPAGSSGNYTGEQWLDTSVSPAQMKVWNGSTWVGIVADELPVSKLQDGAARQLIQTDAAGTGVEWTSNVDVPGTLDVTGASTLDSTLSVAGVATFAAGSAGFPSLTFTGDANSGIYSPGADQVSVATGGTERLRIDSTGQIEAVSLGTAAAPVWSFLADPNTGIYSPGADQVALATNGTERMRLDSSGRLLVGTSSGSGNARLQTQTSQAWVSSSSRNVFRYVKSIDSPSGDQLTLLTLTVPAESLLIFIEATFIGSRAIASDVGTSRISKEMYAIARNGSGYDVVIDSNINSENFEITTTSAGGTSNKFAMAPTATRTDTNANTNPQTIEITAVAGSSGGIRGYVVAYFDITVLGNIANINIS
jgi:hypothetical protein